MQHIRIIELGWTPQNAPNRYFIIGWNVWYPTSWFSQVLSKHDDIESAYEVYQKRVSSDDFDKTVLWDRLTDTVIAQQWCSYYSEMYTQNEDAPT